VRIKLDENLPSRLALTLTGLGHDVDTVSLEGLSGRDDPEVWHAAQLAERFLITQDLDFSDVRQFLPGTHCGVLLVRLRSPSSSALLARIESLFTVGDVSSWIGCLVIATDRRLRIRKAPEPSA
jgi:predicted nuclease of predicted toxin-antitoxin system